MHENLKSELLQASKNKNKTIEQVEECESQTLEANKESNQDEPDFAEGSKGSNEDVDDTYKVFVIKNTHQMAKSTFFNETHTVMTKNKQTEFGSEGEKTKRDENSPTKKENEKDK